MTSPDCQFEMEHIRELDEKNKLFLTKNARIKSSRTIGSDTGMASVLHLIEIEDEDCTIQPNSSRQTFVILKRFTTSLQIEFRESCLYRCSPNLFKGSVTLPRFFGAKIDINSEQLLLEYITNPYYLGDQAKGLDFKHAKQSLKTLALIHSARYTEEKWLHHIKDSFFIHIYPLYIKSMEKLHATNGKSILWDEIGVSNEEVPKITNVLGRICGQYMDIIDKVSAQSSSCLLHGDYRASNLFFHPNEDTVVPIDWQNVSFGAPAFDLAYFLASSLDIGTRRKHEKYLINYYWKCYNNNNTSNYDEDREEDNNENSDLFELYKKALSWPCVWAAVSLAEVGNICNKDPLQNLATLQFLSFTTKRFIQAAIDHNVADPQ